MTTVLTTLIVCATVFAVVLVRRPAAPLAPPVVDLEPVTLEVTRQPSVLDERLLDYVIVTLKSKTTFGGVLYVEDDGALVLAKAQQISQDGTKIGADGEIILLRSDVDFIQRP